MGIKLVRTNLETEYMLDMITHNGFLINEEQDAYTPVNVDQLINSSKFTDVEYRCDCGAFIGQDIIGRTCPLCKTEISLHSLNFRYTGWIDIKPHRVITPIYFSMLKRVLTPNMTKYILGDYKSDLSVPYDEQDTKFAENKKNRKTGRLAADDIAAIKKKVPKAKYIYEGLGHDVFYNRFEEVLRACCKTGCEEEMETLIQNKEAVFTSKIPIYSTAFRPVSKTSETMFYPLINKWLSQIVSIQCKIKDMVLDVEKIQALNFIQNCWNNACDHLIQNEIAKKEGFVRSEIVGGTFSFSARGVIILDTSLRMDEVDVPLTMIMTQYIFKITHIISVRYNMSLEQSYLYALNYKKYPLVISILDELLLREPQWMMILREPTNNFGSIFVGRIRKYKVDDDTISVPEETLKPLNADFDGDQLNGLFLGGESEGIVPMFDKFKFSSMTDYVNRTHELQLLEWTEVCLGLMTE